MNTVFIGNINNKINNDNIIRYFIPCSTAVTEQRGFDISLKENHKWLTIVKARANIVLVY